MKRPAYPKYRSSGVEWLGEVPELWKPVGLKQEIEADIKAIEKDIVRMLAEVTA